MRLVCKVKHDLRSGCRDVLKIERGAVPLASTPKARPCGMVSIRSRQRRRDRAPGPCRPRRRGWRGQQWDAVVGSAESAVGPHPLAWLERNQRERRIHISFLWSVMYRLATSRKHRGQNRTDSIPPGSPKSRILNRHHGDIQAGSGCPACPQASGKRGAFVTFLNVRATRRLVPCALGFCRPSGDFRLPICEVSRADNPARRETFHRLRVRP